MKPENILVDDNYEVIISDFGFAIYKDELHKSRSYTRVGTLEFYPIEMLSPCFLEYSPNKIYYDERADIWSMGVVIFELLYGRTPFFSDNKEDETKKKIREMKFRFPRERGLVFPDAEDLFRRIFVLP